MMQTGENRNPAVWGWGQELPQWGKAFTDEGENQQQMTTPGCLVLWGQTCSVLPFTEAQDLKANYFHA